MKNAKLNLNGIATVIAAESNGSISIDLYNALKMVENTGLCREGCEITEDILVVGRKLNYGQDGKGIDLEADVTLTLRSKAGDRDATEQLFIANKNCLYKHANKKMNLCGRSFDDCLSIVNIAYLVCIQDIAIYNDRTNGVLRSVNRNLLNIKINRIEEHDRLSITPMTSNEDIIRICDTIEKRIKLANIDVITMDDVKKYMTNIYIGNHIGKNAVRHVYDMLICHSCSIDDQNFNDSSDKNDSTYMERELLISGAIKANPTEDAVINDFDTSLVMDAVNQYSDELFMQVFIEIYLNGCTYADIENKYEIEGGRNKIEPMIRKARKKLMEYMYSKDKEQTSIIAREYTGKLKSHRAKSIQIA